MAKYEQYEHHGTEVWVREDLKGKHREHCLCYSCEEFVPDNPALNCPIANENYALCRKHRLVLPVWECAMFWTRDET